MKQQYLISFLQLFLFLQLVLFEGDEILKLTQIIPKFIVLWEQV